MKKAEARLLEVNEKLTNFEKNHSNYIEDNKKLLTQIPADLYDNIADAPEISTIRTRLSSMFARADKTNENEEHHRNSPEFKDMKEALKKLTQVQVPSSALLDDMITKTNTYLEKKQEGWHPFKSTMRDYRISFAKDLLALAQRAKDTVNAAQNTVSNNRDLNYYNKKLAVSLRIENLDAQNSLTDPIINKLEEDCQKHPDE